MLIIRFDSVKIFINFTQGKLIIKRQCNSLLLPLTVLIYTMIRINLNIRVYMCGLKATQS